MAEITARRQGEIIQALFKLLKEEPEGLRAKDAIARLQTTLTVTEFEKATFPSDPTSPRFPKIVRFSTIRSVKAGWLRKQKGIWTLTEDGQAALKALADPEALYRESGRLYRKWKASQPVDETSDAGDGEGQTEEGLLAPRLSRKPRKLLVKPSSTLWAP